MKRWKQITSMRREFLSRPVAAFLLGMVTFLVSTARCKAADWQWSVPVESAISSETSDHPRAFLWIPPDCRHVRAVVLGQHNMEEEPVLENPKFRAALAELGFAEVWVTPAIDLGFSAEKGVGAHFDALFQALAVVSGYSELATAPVVPMGHSASGLFPWRYAAWNPARTLAVLSVSGNWPDFKEPDPPVAVPGLVTIGDYEAAINRLADGLKLQAAHPHLPLSVIAEMGGGHFDTSDRKIEYLALYLKKVAQYRLGPGGELKPIDCSRQGWLVDRWRENDPPKAPAAAVGQYTGDPKEAFWYFDEELARATEEFHAFQRGKKAQLLGYVQDGKVIQQNPNLHAQVALRFLPLQDGISFKLSATFIDIVPPGRPEWWSGLPKGSPIAHGSGPIDITRICGPVAQTGPDTWSIRFYRMGMNNIKRSNEIWLFASHPGDSVFKRSAQQAVLHFPLRNNTGRDQTITFPPIPDQAVGTGSLKLNATSDAQVPICYYVREGPAEIDGDTLKFTPIPPRSKLPIKVTVVAWQYGSSIEPKLKTAEPVERTFNIGGGGSVDTESEQHELTGIWAKATQTIQAIDAAKAAQAARAIQAAKDAPNTVSFAICKALGMRSGDLAGAEARVGNWNNLKGVHPGTTVKLDTIVDKNGQPVPGMTVSFTGGHGGDSFDASTDDNGTANDARLFNGLFDQFDGEPSRIVVSGIPFKRYDVYFYRFDDGNDRGGRIDIGSTQLTIRGGAEPPSPDGKGYIRAVGNMKSGNYVRLEDLSGPTLEARYTAIAAGDPVIMRNKIVGFQIVDTAP